MKMKKIMFGLVMVMMLTMVGCGNGNATNNENPSVDNEVNTEVGDVVVNGNTGEKEEVKEEENGVFTIFAEVKGIPFSTKDENGEVISEFVTFQFVNENDTVCKFGLDFPTDTFEVGEIVKFEMSVEKFSDYSLDTIISWEKVEN
jgi:hypothetical protein